MKKPKSTVVAVLALSLMVLTGGCLGGGWWSRALWDIRAKLDDAEADTLILEAQFDFAADTTMPAAAQVTVATAERLYGKGVANIVRGAFQDRGILP